MMQIDSLQLVKYGHFDDVTVRFGTGLTVVYGRNEAGKSTLLDGLTDFLWGIARNRHPRDFGGPPRTMSLVGHVSVEGAQMKYRRRLADLLDIEGAKVPAPWGEPSDKEMWCNGFGLDHARLLAGGETIVAGDDDPAGIEFLAETGIDIEAVRSAIDDRRDQLFKPHAGAKKVRVRELTEQIRGVEGTIQDGMSSASEVVELRAALTRLEEELVAAAAVEKDFDTRLARTRELVRCHGNAARLREAERELEQIRASGRCLSRDKVASLKAAITQLGQSREDQQKAKTELDTLHGKEQLLAPNTDLLNQGVTIDELVQKVESGKQDLALITGDQVAEARADVQACLGALGMAGENLEDEYRRVLLSSDRIEQLDRVAREVESAHDSWATQQRRVEGARSQMAAAATSESGSVDTTLHETRTRRDEAWYRVRDPWLSGELPETDSREQLARDVDSGIASADMVAENQAESLAAAAELLGTRKALAATLAEEEKKLDDCSNAKDMVIARWVTLVEETGLLAGTDPAAWQVRSRHLQELQQAWDNWQRLAVAVTNAAERYATFEMGVAAVAEVLRDAGKEPFANLERFRLEWVAARTAVGNLKEIAEQQSAAQVSLTRAEIEQNQAKDEIVAIASDDDPAELVERSVALHQKEDLVKQFLTTLRDQKNPDSDLEVLLAELARTDEATLTQQQELLKEKLGSANAKRLALSTDQGAIRTKLDDVEARKSVAELKAEREELIGQLREAVDEYRNLYIQGAILDAYRESLTNDSGTGILEAAGEFLNRLTEGRYTGFAIANDGPKRVLRIESRIDASGDVDEMKTSELSTGTEYQVYFALRLAGIAAKQRDRVATGQPTLPVVLDDVLLAYDDYRSKAALSLLTELGQQFQIVLLTHSRSVLAEAKKLAEVGTVELPSPVFAADEG